MSGFSDFIVKINFEEEIINLSGKLWTKYFFDCVIVLKMNKLEQ